MHCSALAVAGIGLCLIAGPWSCGGVDQSGDPGLVTVKVDTSATRFSRLVVTLRDSAGKPDTLFDDSLERTGQLDRLGTKAYHGGKTVLFISGYSGDTVVYLETRAFDPANPAGTRRDTLLDRSAELTAFAWSARESFLSLTDTTRILTLALSPAKADERATLSIEDTDVVALKEVSKGTQGRRFRIQPRKAGRTWIRAVSAAHPEWSDSTSVLITTVASTFPKPINRTPLWSTTSRPTWYWSSAAPKSLGFYRVRLDNDTLAGGLLVGDTSYASPEALTEGAHTLFVQERDSTGAYSAIAGLALTVDTQAPEAPEVANDSSAPNDNPRPSWNWISKGGGNGSFRVKIDGEDLEAGSAAVPVRKYASPDSLAPGFHVLRVQERDDAGNWSPSGSAAVELLAPDQTPPNAPIGHDIPFGNDITTYSVTWGAGGGDGIGTYRYLVDKTDFGASPVVTRDSSYTPGADLDASLVYHFVLVQERDAKGNWSEATRIDFQAFQGRFLLSKVGSMNMVLALDSNGQAVHLSKPIRTAGSDEEKALQRRQIWMFDRNHRPMGGYEIRGFFGTQKSLKHAAQGAVIATGVTDFRVENAAYLWAIDSIPFFGSTSPAVWGTVKAVDSDLRLNVSGPPYGTSSPIILREQANNDPSELWISERLDVWFLR